MYLSVCQIHNAIFSNSKLSATVFCVLLFVLLSALKPKSRNRYTEQKIAQLTSGRFSTFNTSRPTLTWQRHPDVPQTLLFSSITQRKKIPKWPFGCRFCPPPPLLHQTAMENYHLCTPNVPRGKDTNCLASHDTASSRLS